MLTIHKLRDDMTIDFAAQELRKYLRMMQPDENQITITAKDGDGFRLGLLQDFGLPNDAQDPVMDDIVHIETTEKGGILAGSNPRSVLFAVYRLLKLNGCRFLFPGAEGEFVPLKDITLKPGILLVSITRGSLTEIPGGMSTFHKGDIVVVVTGSGNVIHQLNDIFA